VLDALARQVDPPPFEIVVGVDGADEPDIADAPLQRHCARLVVVRFGTAQGVSVARNRAVERAEGDCLGFLDDDVEPASDWVSTLAKDLSGDEVAVAGRISEQPGTAILGRLRALAFEHRHGQSAGRENVDYVNGGNCGFRADVFRELGGFDPAFRKSQDRDLARRTVLAGHRIRYDQAVVVNHAGSYTLRGLLRGRFRAGRAAQVMKRLSGDIAVGPTDLRTTYGGGVMQLARRHGPLLALAALASLAAYRAGRVSARLGIELPNRQTR
jgi:GT2 family glycosyltransferase